MKPENVAQYLRDNPQFFDDYAEMLADIRIPHPHDDRVISISERQMATLREKNRQLQDKLYELIRIGENNDAISEKIHRLTVALLSYHSLEEMLHGLHEHLREDFSIPQVALRLWFSSDAISDDQRPEFTPVSETLRTTVDSMPRPYCGPHLPDEVKLWFGRDAKHLQSFSMVPLLRQRSIGLLVMASPEPERFYPDMGTLYLERLGELIAGTLARFEHEHIEISTHEFS